MHAGRAAERGDADARVVGERGQLRVRARVPRLGERVLDERQVRLVGFGDAELGLRDRRSMPSGASSRRNSRSLPALLDARTSCSTACDHAAGRCVTRSQQPQRLLLARDQVRDARFAERRSAHRSAARVNGAPSAVPCNSTKPPRAGHHDVHVGVAGRVLGVVEVEHRHAVDDADRHRGDEIAQRLAGDEAALAAPARSRRRARRTRR